MYMIHNPKMLIQNYNFNFSKDKKCMLQKLQPNKRISKIINQCKNGAATSF
jgi:hypothetical protein